MKEPKIEIETKDGRIATLMWIEPNHTEGALDVELKEAEGYNRAVRDILVSMGDERYKDIPLDLTTHQDT